MESANIPNLGSSLPVPCVQELAKETITTVPPRYLRPDQDPPFVLHADSLPQLPVIDMNNLSSDNFIDSELWKLHTACKEWGFFQLINHGVSNSLMEKVKAEIQEIFDMPIEEKQKYWQKPGEMEGFGQTFVMSDVQKLDWGDMFYMITLPHYLRNPNLFPKLPLPFRETMEAYSAELKRVALSVLGLMAKALKMEAEDVRVLFEEGFQNMRMNYYPPCPQPELVIGLKPHSDGGGLTILFQVTDTEGLQIRKGSDWIPVKPLPEAFIINVGDMLEIVTNGVYRSAEHRATVNSVKERISIATFYNPRLDGELGPAPSLIKPETPALYKRIGVADFLKGFFSTELRGKSFVDTMKI